MSVVTHLAQYGVTVAQARDFVAANMNNLGLVHEVARSFQITNDMLGEIVGGVPGDLVRDYFDAHGLPGAALDAKPLFTSQLAQLGGIISLNAHEGSLSTASLRDRVMAATGSAAYERAFDPDRYDGSADGAFTVAELGAPASLGSLPATSETVQSLFFGTIVNALRAIDYEESLALQQFATDHLFNLARGDGATIDQFATLLVSVFQDAADQPVMPAADVADAAVGAGTALVQLVAQGGDASLFQGFVASFLT